MCFDVQYHNKLRKEAEERGEKYKVTKLKRQMEMDEYDFLHWRRSFEEREALLRDISWYSLNFFEHLYCKPATFIVQTS